LCAAAATIVGAAHAAPAPQAPVRALPPAPPPPPAIDVSAAPAACKSFAGPAQAPNPVLAWPARVALASCMAEQAVAPLALCDCGQSVVDVDDAVAPALAILDGVIAGGDPASQALASHAKGALYDGFAARLIATLPEPSHEATPEELSLHDMRAQALAPQLTPWREAAAAAFAHAVEVARAHPEVARNPAAASAIRDSQQRQAADVAGRDQQQL
jgi:hypothetical protein